MLSYASPPHGSDPLNDICARAADSGWGHLQLPARHTLDQAPEAADALAATTARLLQLGALVNGEILTASRVVIGAARTVRADAVRSRLTARDLTGITVDTADRLQGREFDVTLARHPLSGRQDSSAFHPETGRLCVLLSRHRFACIVVVPR